MTHVLFTATVVAAAALFALLEIQIEGPEGWARSLPTWRVENRWTRRLLGARAITGYHLYVHLFLLVALHLPFLLRLTAFTWGAEARLAAFWCLFWVLEDFLWFVLNPAYGLRGFTAEKAWWHAPNWWLFMPRDYWVFIPLGILLYVISL